MTSIDMWVERAKLSIRKSLCDNKAKSKDKGDKGKANTNTSTSAPAAPAALELGKSAGRVG